MPLDFNDNDAVIKALRGWGCYNDLIFKELGDLGYTGTFNDRMYQFLKDFYSATSGTYNDLMHRFIAAGEDFPPSGSTPTNGILAENGDFLITESSNFIIQES